ncbi:hypothetical protein MTP99_008913 [Tenebrio molitor]|nr:hypothetical protein MTP99_008913 [Tenebrio molitor]
MAPPYKLIYFDKPGRGEPIRLLFKYGGVVFEDVLIKREDWAQLKQKTPFGQLPLLEHNGKRVNQSVSICRYLGKLVKLAGKDDWEDLEIDAVVDTITDLRAKITIVRLEKNVALKKTMKEEALKETVPFYLSRLDALVQKNNGFLALGRLTWADLYFVGKIPIFSEFMGEDTIAKYTNLKALIDKIHALPGIKK